MSDIRVKGVSKIFGPDPAAALALLERGKSKDELLAETGHAVGVHDVTLTVERGEIFVIMGLSGSGKSTLLRCINRLIEPTRGEIWLGDLNVTAMDRQTLRELRRNRLGMVFQRFALFPHRTVLDNVAYGLEVQGIPREQRRAKAMDVVGLVGLKGWENYAPEQLSGGMQQRVGLARALAIDPDVLLMDEPFSALDPLIRREMQKELLELQRTVHKTIIFVTHDLDEALKLGDRIAMMKDGRVVQVGTPEAILAHPANAYVSEFVQDVDRSRVFKASHVMTRPDALVADTAGPRLALRQMRKAGLSSIFVVDGDNVLKGLVTADDAVAAAQRGEERLDGILTHDIHATSPDTLLADLIPLAATTRYPIAVVDDARGLLGIIVRVSLLAGLVGPTGTAAATDGAVQAGDAEAGDAEERRTPA